SASSSPLTGSVRLPGTLRPYEEVNIYGKINGFVRQVFVDRGSQVKRGQTLITLEAPEMESQIQASVSRFVQSQENAVASKEKYKRLKEAASEEGAVAPLDLDNALSRYRADQAISQAESSNVASLRTIQGYLNITAPFAGTIIQRNISAGALVGPDSKNNDKPMLVLQSVGKLRLEVHIPEAYVENVNLNREVNIVYNSMPGVQHKAKISRSANALGTLRSEAIEIDIANPSGNFKPGMYAEVTIPLISAAKTLLVPTNSIVRSTERQYLVVVENNRTKIVDVKVGLSANDSTEVFGNVTKGDRIILHATDEIQHGVSLQ
ncbi:MAG: efflux RND transporter periplasmic adaptor subunit, partial [Chitinophagaceae bacterium]